MVTISNIDGNELSSKGLLMNSTVIKIVMLMVIDRLKRKSIATGDTGSNSIVNMKIIEMAKIMSR